MINGGLLKRGALILSATCLWVACSDDLKEGPERPDLPNVAVTEGFVNINLHLPSEMPTGFRAASTADGTGENDRFDDGEAYEYAVSEGILAFFEGDKPDAANANPDKDATFKLAYSLGDTEREIEGWEGQWNMDGGTTDNVTAMRHVVAEAPKPEEGKQMYALVILNPNGVVKINESNEQLEVKNGESYTTVTKLTDLQKAYAYSVDEMTKKGDQRNSFFMTNAPISDRATAASGAWSSTTVNSSDAPKVTTLVPVTVYDNIEAARQLTNGGGAQVYVERSVAKVEVKGKSDVTTGTDGSLTYKVLDSEGKEISGHTVTFKGWKLNVTNKTAKVVHDVMGPLDATGYPAYSAWAGYFNTKATANVNRFFGATANPYRVYWAIDGNYDDSEYTTDNYQSTNFNVYSTAPTNWNSFSTTEKGSYEYCLENTMIAQQMTQGLTTGVLLEARYSIQGDGDESGDLFTLGGSSHIYSKAEMLKRVSDALGLTSGQTLTFTATTAMEINSVDEYKAAFKVGGSELSEEQLQKLMGTSSTAINTINPINYYKEGRTYYYTRPIRHFGDYYTPLYKDESKVNSVGSATEYTDADHLGRYGVVRNNWYEIVIGSVSNPGSPVIPDIPVDPENPDDPEKGYVHVDIHILSWAKRSQEIDL